jgi:hypothetical protein
MVKRRKSLHRTEKWKGKRGRVKVTRNTKGQFVTWHRVRRYTRGTTARQKWETTARKMKWTIGTATGGKGVAVYGGNKRIQMRGSGTELYKAMKIVVKHPPKEQFLDITAEEVLHHPERFLEKGYWQGRPEIESR